MHENPIWPKGHIDAWKSYMAQGTYRVYTGQYYRRMEILYCRKGRIDMHENPVLPQIGHIGSVKVFPWVCNLGHAWYMQRIMWTHNTCVSIKICKYFGAKTDQNLSQIINSAPTRSVFASNTLSRANTCRGSSNVLAQMQIRQVENLLNKKLSWSSSELKQSNQISQTKIWCRLQKTRKTNTNTQIQRQIHITQWQKYPNT